MGIGILLLMVIGIAMAGYASGRATAASQVEGELSQLKSLPAYHGAFVAMCAVLPAMVVLIAWVVIEPIVLRWIVLGAMGRLTEGLNSAQIDLLYAEVVNLGGGSGSSAARDELRQAASGLFQDWRVFMRDLEIALVLLSAGIGALMGVRHVRRGFRARVRVETATRWLMILCSIIAIATTVGIVASLIGESVLFFGRVPISDFLFGLRWSPQEALRADQAGGSGAFGAIPLLAGTFLIALIALIVAVPLGIMSAVFLAEYASPRVRNALKPVLEILAGIPTVVYGFFAILFVAPLFPPIDAAYESMMDDGIEELARNYITADPNYDETASESYRVPLLLPSRVVQLPAVGLRDAIDRLSDQEAAHILDQGTEVFQPTVTRGNISNALSLFPIEDRLARLETLGGIEEQLGALDLRVSGALAEGTQFAGLEDEIAAVEESFAGSLSRSREDALRPLRAAQRELSDLQATVTGLRNVANEDRRDALMDLLRAAEVEDADTLANEVSPAYAEASDQLDSFMEEVQTSLRNRYPVHESETGGDWSFASFFYAIFGYVLLGASSQSALAAGLVMGIMIIPLVTSLSDDVINAVPQTMRDGSNALGATHSETVKKVILPAALPGIVGAVLLAASRAIGETMIVVMAAGLAAPNLFEEPLAAINPFAELTTVTVQIATLLTGDQEFDSAKTLSVFALGLLLFVMTLALNLVSLRIVQKYREQYE